MYLTGCVIPCGIPDVDDDVLSSKDIKIIFAKYMNRLTDIQHNDISYYGVEVLANWVSETDTTIAGRTVPAKSWLATVKVMNPEIIDLVKRGELRGFSLSSTYVGEVDKKTDERVSYSDLQSSEEIIPIRISLVKKPANGFAFEEADYETFINKMEENNMGDESKFTLGDLKNIFKFKSDLEETIIEKQAPEEEGDAGADEAEKSVDALFEKVDILLEKVSGIEEALKKREEEAKAEEEAEEEADKKEEADDEKIEKADEEADKEEDADKKEEADEEADKKEEAKEEADKKEETEEEADKEEDKIEKSDDECEDDKKIDKSAEEKDTKKINKGITTKAHDVPELPVEKPSTFYNRTKRDHLGRKIRQ